MLSPELVNFLMLALQATIYVCYLTLIFFFFFFFLRDHGHHGKFVFTNTHRHDRRVPLTHPLTCIQSLISITITHIILQTNLSNPDGINEFLFFPSTSIFKTLRTVNAENEWIKINNILSLHMWMLYSWIQKCLSYLFLYMWFDCNAPGVKMLHAINVCSQFVCSSKMNGNWEEWNLLIWFYTHKRILN